MKKFNKSEIFKRMWQLVKEAKLSRSAALSRAWAEAKAVVELPELTGTEKQVAYAKSLFEKMNAWCDEQIKYYETRKEKARVRGIKAVELTRAEFTAKYENSKNASTIIDAFRGLKVQDRCEDIYKELKAIA